MPQTPINSETLSGWLPEMGSQEKKLEPAWKYERNTCKGLWGTRADGIAEEGGGVWQDIRHENSTLWSTRNDLGAL